MKKNLQRLGYIGVAILLILGGFQVIIFGTLETTSISSSVYQFNGLERAMGILPIAFGSLLIYLIVTKQTKLDE